jgi:glycosyltransferase involved in cell wall biosynthesis
MKPEKAPRTTGRSFGPADAVEGLLTDATGRQRRSVRLDLSAIRRSAAVGTPALVSCVMLTAGRPLQARIAIDCFRRQSWPRRQLVIVDTSTETSLENWVRSLGDPAINFKRLPRGGTTLGGLRNLATDRARGDFVCVWDDDDLHHPIRIEAQMTALASTGAAACLLGRLFIWWPGRRELAASLSRAWEGTLLCRRDAMPRYDAEGRSEDTPAVKRLIARERVIQVDAPELYLYVRHDANTCPEPHFEGNLMKAVRRLAGQQYDDALARMATAYPVAEYLNAISVSADRAPPAAPATADIGQSPAVVPSIG